MARRRPNGALRGRSIGHRARIAITIPLALVGCERSQPSGKPTPLASPVASPSGAPETRPRAADQSGPANPRRVLFHPRDPTRLLIAEAGPPAAVWNVADLDHPFKETAISTAAAVDAAFAPDGQSILTVERDGSLHCWDVDGGEKWNAKLSSGALYAVATTTRPPLIAAGGVDRTIHLLAPDGKERATLLGQEGVVLSLAFSPHGTWLASDGSDTVVRLWQRAQDGGYAQKRSFRAPNEKYQKMLPNLVRLDVQWGWGETVAFSADEELLLIANLDGTARIWMRDGMPSTQPFTNHDGQHVRAVAYSPRGDVVATAGFDGTIRLWKPDGLPFQEDAAVRHGRVATSVSFSADGKTIASTGLDDRVVLTPLDGSAPVALPSGTPP